MNREYLGWQVRVHQQAGENPWNALARKQVGNVIFNKEGRTPQEAWQRMQ